MSNEKQSELFLGKLSHELRNPLTLIYSNLQLIEKQHPEVLSFENWNYIQEDLHFLHSMLNDISQYGNSSRLCISEFCFSDFMRQLALSFAASCTESNINFTSVIPSSLPRFHGDKTKLREVFLNLLINAKDALREKGTIRLQAAHTSDTLIIRVEDNGSGIAREHLDSLFLPFVTYKKNGTGLGLFLCKSIVELHHGKIHIESQEHAGTRVTVALPI